MNKRCIINVATGDFYCKMQDRLHASLFYTRGINGMNDRHIIYDDGRISYLKGTKTAQLENPDLNIGGTTQGDIDAIFWHDCLPAGSRSHSESPYGFKIHAVKAAYEMGYTSILWLDSPAYAVKEDITPIFEKIEKEGYYAMSHIDPLEKWVGVEAMDTFGIESRDQLHGLNLPSGSCYGFYLNDNTGRGLFESMWLAERNGLFKNEKFVIPNDAGIKELESSWHRHDEAILALSLINFDVPVFTFDPLFQSDDERCVIKSGGEWTQ